MRARDRPDSGRNAIIDRATVSKRSRSNFSRGANDIGRTTRAMRSPATRKDLSSGFARVSDLPVAVGFGVSTSEHVKEVWRFADAAVIGSAIVSEVEKLNGIPDLASRIGDFARSLTAR
jgi:tryptophan synthase alpha chain